MMRPKFIFFDVANTLLAKPQLPAAIARALAHHGIHAGEPEVAGHLRMLSEQVAFPSKTSKEFYRFFNSELLISLGQPADPKIVDAIYCACRQLPWAPFEDTITLRDLAVPLGIVSNWDTTLETVINENFGSMFFSITGSERTGYSKPDPAIYRTALENLDCLPGEVLYIGDSPALDYYPAREAGIHSVLIDRENMFPHFSGEKISTLYELNPDGTLCSVGPPDHT